MFQWLICKSVDFSSHSTLKESYQITLQEARNLLNGIRSECITRYTTSNLSPIIVADEISLYSKLDFGIFEKGPIQSSTVKQ